MATIPQKTSQTKAGPSTPESDVIVSWRAPKYQIYSNRPGRYTALTSGGLAIIVLSFVLDYFSLLQVSPWLTAGVVIAGIIALISLNRQEPPEGQYAITDQGLGVDDRLLAWSDLKTFTVVDMGDHHLLRVWPKRRLALLPTSLILNEELDPTEVREAMKEFLPEAEAIRSWSDQISALIHF